MVENGDKLLGATATQVIEIDLGDQIGHDVVAAISTEDMAFEFTQANRANSRPPEVPRRMQQIEMRAGSFRADRARHPKACLEQRPIKRLAIEGNQDAPLGESLF